MFGIIGLYIWFYSNLGAYITRLINEGNSIAEALRKGLPPAYSFGMAAATDGLTGLAHLGIFALWSIVPFAATYFVLTRNFLRLATSNKNVSTTVYRKRELKVSSGFGALVRKELTRFFTLPIYVINCVLGNVFMLIAAGYTVLRLDQILEVVAMMPGDKGLITPTACLVLGLRNFNNTARPSLSLEGRSALDSESAPGPARYI